jgi:hypothetical protein
MMIINRITGGSKDSIGGISAAKRGGSFDSTVASGNPQCSHAQVFPCTKGCGPDLSPVSGGIFAMQAARGYIYVCPADVNQCCAGQQVSRAGIENRPALHTGLRAYHL